jgi:hypothetical protein
MAFTKFAFLSIFILIGTAFSASAQNVLGEITATLDGKPRVWYMTSGEGTSQSNWTGDAKFADVTLWGHASADTVSVANDSLIIQFKMVKMGRNLVAMDVEAAHPTGPNWAGYYVNNDKEATLTIESAEIADGSLTIAGTFSATLFYSEGIRRTKTNGETKTVAGSFHASIAATTN